MLRGKINTENREKRRKIPYRICEIRLSVVRRSSVALPCRLSRKRCLLLGEGGGGDDAPSFDASPADWGRINFVVKTQSKVVGGPHAIKW